MHHPARTIIVTGASSGLGYAIAAAFVKKGWNVVGNARMLDRLATAKAKLGNPGNFILVEGDIGKPDTATRLFDEAIAAFGKVDVLVNNAGIFNAKPFTDYSVQELDDLVDTNLRGFVYPSQMAAACMSRQKHGHIINITASIATQPQADVPAVLPILIKGGLNHATRALAIELAPHNVKVNAVSPGIIDTPLYTPDMHTFLNTLQPLGHIGNIQDVVDAVVYLTDAQFVTGTILPVDGGATAGRW